VTATQVLAAAAALAVVAGAALVVAGLRAPTGRVQVRRARRWGAPRPAPAAWARARWAAAPAAALLGWALTGWPAAGVASAAAVLGLPVILGASGRAQRQIDRAEAVEEWARRVADVLAIGVGLEQAIQTAARTAPAPIADEAVTLAARIAARTPTETALRRFADELDDPTADLVLAALILAARRRGPGVAAALTALAESVGEEVVARRRVESDRAKPRATARAVMGITGVMIVLGLANRGYTEPYGTALGQVVLAATLGFFGAALWWMHGMTRSTPPARLLGAGQEDPA
jgi:Flp pilus assembly protein TadB